MLVSECVDCCYLVLVVGGTLLVWSLVIWVIGLFACCWLLFVFGFGLGRLVVFGFGFDLCCLRCVFVLFSFGVLSFWVLLGVARFVLIRGV